MHSRKTRIVTFTLFAAALILVGIINDSRRAFAAGKNNSKLSIVLSFAGDCTFGTVNSDDSSIRFPAVFARSGLKDYPFALVRPWFENSDLTAVNFECTLTNGTHAADKQWHFKGAASYANIFAAAGVDVLTLANNHSFDYMQSGFDDTLVNFKKADMPVCYQNVPFITTIKGVQVVLIADCTVVGENTTRLDGVSGRVIGEIRRYKTPNNLVIVFMHWGSELDTTPRPWQQAMGHGFIDAGADAVVACHPHVLQGIERYAGKYIAYSLGNFAFGGNSLARHPETVIFRLRFPVVAGKAGIADASIVPCLTTSSTVRNAEGILINDYQPKPLSGADAQKIADLVLARSAGLKYGLKQIAY